jgi:hypothetical protein
MQIVRGPADPDFSERERLALESLRPHLHAVWQDAERRRTGVPGLTQLDAPRSCGWSG